MKDPVDHILRLEDALTDEDIKSQFPRSVGIWMEEDLRSIRACIALAVEKAEKVSGFLSAQVVEVVRSGGNVEPILWRTPHSDGKSYHALLLLGPKYEPKPVKSAEERIDAALKNHAKRTDCMCEQCVILRGEVGR